MSKNDGKISDDVINKTVDKMFVLFGCEILKIVPGIKIVIIKYMILLHLVTLSKIELNKLNKQGYYTFS